MAPTECVVRVSVRDADGRSRFATLQEAVEASRRLRARSASCRIVVEGGVHFVEAPVCLDARDSHLILEGASGESALLCGGRSIEGWRAADDGLWVADVPEAKDGAWNFRVLIVNGRWCDRARLPEEGWFTLESDADVAPLWQNEVEPAYAEYTTLVYDPADLGPDFDAKNAEVRVYHAWDESLVRVASLDADAHTMTLYPPCVYAPGTFARREYVIWNTRQGLTRSGQWYVDRVAGKVFYRPLPGETLDAVEAVAPRAESVLQLHGSAEAPVENIVVRNLTFTATRSRLTNETLLDLVSGPASVSEISESLGVGGRNSEGAVSLRHARSCTLAGLTLRQIGGQAVKARDVRKCRVVGCHISEIGAAGVAVCQGDEIDLSNNRIEGVGKLFPSANGILVSYADHVIIRHNDIHDAPYSGISLNSCKHGSICSNRISRVMQEIDDGGGIYTSFGEHIIMRGNSVSDFTDSARYEGNIRHAYYFDVGCIHGLLEGNIAVRCTCLSHVHMAEQIVIRDNIFMSDRGGSVSFRRSTDCLFERNVVQVDGDLELHDVEAQVVDRNVLFTRTGRIVALSTREPGGVEVELRIEPTNVLTDPGVVEGREGRFGVCSRELADALGLKPVNVAAAGCGEACAQFFTFMEDVNDARQRLTSVLVDGMKRARAEGPSQA